MEGQTVTYIFANNQYFLEFKNLIFKDSTGVNRAVISAKYWFGSP